LKKQEYLREGSGLLGREWNTSPPPPEYQTGIKTNVGLGQRSVLEVEDKGEEGEEGQEKKMKMMMMKATKFLKHRSTTRDSAPRKN
jgi:hypothetical protein